MFRSVLIRAAFTIIDRYLISKITYDPLSVYLKKLIAPAQEVSDLLTDKNPDNDTQLKAFFEENKAFLVNSSIDTTIAIVDKEVKDVQLKLIVISLLDEIKFDQGLEASKRLS